MPSNNTYPCRSIVPKAQGIPSGGGASSLYLLHVSVRPTRLPSKKCVTLPISGVFGVESLRGEYTQRVNGLASQPLADMTRTEYVTGMRVICPGRAGVGGAVEKGIIEPEHAGVGARSREKTSLIRWNATCCSGGIE